MSDVATILVGGSEEPDFMRIIVRADADTPTANNYPSTIELEITVRREDLTAQFDQLLDERQTTALIDALTIALAQSRAAAEERRARGLASEVAEHQRRLRERIRVKVGRP